MKLQRNKDFKYQRVYGGKISAYTTTYNCIKGGYPFIESVSSALAFADEVVVVDGCSDDGTFEKLESMASEDERIQIYQNEFDWTNPTVDGDQKSFARALCSNDFLIQIDSDEVFHEDDAEKWKLLTKKFPTKFDIIHLPVVELWGCDGEVTGRRSAWKWRISKNKPEISHGVNKFARLTDEETGKLYAKKGASDGCEYINLMSYEPIAHTGFWNQHYESLRLSDPDTYAKIMNQIFQRLPSVYHYSWFDLNNKLEQLKPGGTWDKMWSLLYQEETQNRFPDVDFSDKKQVKELIKKLHDQGGEDSDRVKYKFKFEKSQPAIMKNWIKSRKS